MSDASGTSDVGEQPEQSDGTPGSSVYQDADQDTEPTMTAPAGERPTGTVDRDAGQDGAEGGSGESTADATGAS